MAVPSVNDPTVIALGSPTVTVPLLSETSISFEVPEYVTVPPKDTAVVLLPSETVIVYCSVTESPVSSPEVSESALSSVYVQTPLEVTANDPYVPIV